MQASSMKVPESGQGGGGGVGEAVDVSALGSAVARVNLCTYHGALSLCDALLLCSAWLSAACLRCISAVTRWLRSCSAASESAASEPARDLPASSKFF